MSFINLNSRIVHADLPLLNPGHRALRYGDGIFESMRMEHGKLFFADFHAVRLQESLALLHVHLPQAWDSDFLRKEVAEVCEANQLQSARIRMQVWREGDGFYAPSSSTASFSISAMPLEGNGFHMSEKGLNLCTYHEQTKSYGRLSSLKSSSALLYVMASLFAQQQQCEEAVILNSNGRIAEASSSNIWFIKNDQWYTPALSEAGVDGVMRRVLLGILRQLSIPVFETQISLSDIADFDHVLISNASRGLRFVENLDNQTYSAPDLSALLQALNEYARSSSI